MNILKPMTAALIGASLLAAFTLNAYAQDVVKTDTGASYLNGGVGGEEQAEMRRRAAEFPIRMTFSTGKDGEYVANASVVITDAHGKSVFELSNAGPMLDVALPNGSYKVNVSVEGVTESHAVTVSGRAGKDLQFHWK